MELEGIMLSDISQMEKKIPYDFTHMCNITNKINEQTKPNKNKHIDTENRVVITKGKG